MVKKFVELLAANLNLPTLRSFQDSMQLLSFLNDIQLDPTSVGYLAEDMYLPVKLQTQNFKKLSP